jgi:hypothetical protein
MPDVHLVDKRDDGGTAQLFRAEAMDHYQRGSSDEGHLLEMEPAWTRWAYRVIVAFFGAMLLLSAVIPVDREAAGGGVVRSGRLVAVVPARARAELRAGQPLRFELIAQPLTLESAGTKILSPSEARQLLGVDGAAFWPSPEPAVRIDASLPAAIGNDYSDGVAGRVRVRLGRERLLFVLIPALRGRHG